MARESKQAIFNEVTDLLGLERYHMPKGGGSSLPSHVFREAARRTGVTTGSMPEISERVIRRAGHPWHPSYDSRSTPSQGGSTVTLTGLRAFANALNDLIGRSGPLAFLLIWNPPRWKWSSEDMAAAIDATAAGRPVTGTWLVGGQPCYASIGDRAFLLQRGAEPWGIVASGRFQSEVYRDSHRDGSGKGATYAEVEWDTVVDQGNPLPLSDIVAATSGRAFAPMESGALIQPGVRRVLEDLWTRHVSLMKPSLGGQARQHDAERRKKTEDAAQERLMRHYREQGWVVEDRRIGNPYDAIATKDDEIRYLEAKGTTSWGETVIVTRNEVAWAQRHPGEHVIGIWSRMEFDSTGNVDEASGTFRVFEWDPTEEDLAPITFDWAVGGARLHP